MINQAFGSFEAHCGSNHTPSALSDLRLPLLQTLFPRLLFHQTCGGQLSLISLVIPRRLPAKHRSASFSVNSACDGSCISRQPDRPLSACHGQVQPRAAGVVLQLQFRGTNHPLESSIQSQRFRAHPCTLLANPIVEAHVAL